MNGTPRVMIACAEPFTCFSGGSAAFAGLLKIGPRPMELIIVPESCGFPFAAPSAFERAVRSIRNKLSGGESFVSTIASTPMHKPGCTTEETVDPTVTC